MLETTIKLKVCPSHIVTSANQNDNVFTGKATLSILVGIIVFDFATL